MSEHRTEDQRAWNRCDECGRFIAFKDFDDGAIRQMVTPDSDYSAETWETICKDCVRGDLINSLPIQAGSQ